MIEKCTEYGTRRRDEIGLLFRSTYCRTLGTGSV